MKGPTHTIRVDHRVSDEDLKALGEHFGQTEAASVGQMRAWIDARIDNDLDALRAEREAY